MHHYSEHNGFSLEAIQEGRRPNGSWRDMGEKITIIGFLEYLQKDVQGATPPNLLPNNPESMPVTYSVKYYPAENFRTEFIFVRFRTRPLLY